MSQAAQFRKMLSFLLLGALALYLIGNARVSLWDRDEPRYAECSREMLQSGDWVVPRFLQEWRLEKPPLIYWCQAAVMSVIGDTPQAARLPSTVAIVFSGGLLALIVNRLAGPRRALWSAFIFCTCGLAIAAAKMCITDAVLLAFVLTGQACLALMYAAEQRHRCAPFWVAIIFWISTGLAGLTKGPQALGFHCFTMLILLALDRSSGISWKRGITWWRQLHPIVGVPILAMVVAPWLVMIHQRAPGFVTELLHKARMHAGGSMEGHGEPPGYHLLLIFGTFFPWSLLLPTAISLAWQNRKLPHVRFAFAAAAGPWLLMEMVYTKLPFYVLPAFPGLAFLTADALIRCSRGQFDDLKRQIFKIAVLIWAVAALGLAAAPWVALKITPDLPRPALITFSVCGAMYALIVSLRFLQKQVIRAALVMGIGMVVMIAVLFGLLIPRLDFLRLSLRLAADLKSVGATGSNVPVMMIDYKEPSLAFAQGGGTREQVDDQYLVDVPPEQWPRWVVVSMDEWKKVPNERRAQVRVLFSEQGFAYADQGRYETVLILEKISDSPQIVKQ
jgi:4-amino-4-deoxy-L-arabinose transferase-like glycosyltransferase